MKTTTLPTASAPQRTSILQRLVQRALADLESGTLDLHVQGPGGPVTTSFGQSVPGAPHAEATVHDPAFWSALALRGSIGAGEAYARGWWTSPDPVAVVRLFVRNQDALQGMEGGLALLSRPLHAALHFLNRNNHTGSRRNIRAHYDVSNAFFELFLDDTMTYSCGIFEDERTTLREASVAKIDQLCRMLDLQPDDHLLEIGTGWGAFALHAAREYGCRVTTTTISAEQHKLAAERFREAGLEDRITLLFEDYRGLTGQYDKLVSVEMIEAVGARFYPTFFKQCSALLKPEGTMALQAITIADQHFDRARRSVDFIQKHVFPGSCIPSVTALLGAATEASDLRLTRMDDIGPHYVRTLSEWRHALRARWQDARDLGYEDDFLRQWEFYFAYCEGGFAERHISDVQMVLQRSGARPGAWSPALSAP